jgi:hypothetical protein
LNVEPAPTLITADAVRTCTKLWMLMPAFDREDWSDVVDWWSLLDEQAFVEALVKKSVRNVASWQPIGARRLVNAMKGVCVQKTRERIAALTQLNKEASTNGESSQVDCFLVSIV